MLETIREIVTLLLVLIAALMCAAAGLGLLRFPDVLARLHAATKPQILGLMAVCADIAINSLSLGTLTMGVAIVFFQALTAPISAHMVARASYRAGNYRPDVLITDELKPRTDLR